MMEIIRMIVVLSAITGLSGFALSGIKQVTDPIIEEQILTNVQGPALQKIFVEGNNDPIADRKTLSIVDGQEVIVFPSLKDGKLLAVAMEAGGKGYGGDVNVLVGFDVAKDAILGISITTHKETPGLGSRVEDPSFTKQFRGLPLDKAALKRDGGDIDAVSGATFSSLGASSAANQAAKWYESIKDSIKTSW
ncbi:MAG: FMN-binding protein [Desulfomicrobium sp.]|jgi:electron transport complex protein RnfG|nr:FMN-binding protein [Desulfomicrobium sp.]NLV96910.1 FMN-binding protein [Desulfovibrionales bacterium]